MCPTTSAPIFFKRLDYREASLGHKIQLLGLMQDAIKELANAEEDEPEFETKSISRQTYSDEFKDFYEEPLIETELSKAQEEIKDRIDSKTVKKMSYYTKQKEVKIKHNYLLSVSERFLYPLVAIPNYSSTYMTFLENSDLC